MQNQFIAEIVWDVLILLGFIFIALQAFGVIKIKDEEKRKRLTSKKFKMLSCVGCALLVVIIIMKFV